MMNEFEEIEYGTVAIVPKGEYDQTVAYDVANLVTHDGSSYLAHTKPPVGTLPTDMNYWQVSAQGASKATPTALGVVKPDGATTQVDADGVLSVKAATQSTVGAVKGSAGITVGEDGGMDVNTEYTQATGLANLIAGEAIAEVLGKISKSISVTMGLDQNALLKNMLTSIDVNDPNKIPTSAYIHKLVERIGMGVELSGASNLTAGYNQLNSDMQIKNISNEFTPVKLYVSTVKAYQSGKVVMVFGTFTKDLPTGSVGNVADVISINDSRYYPIFFSPGCDSTTSATADVPIKINVFADPAGVIKAMSPAALTAAKRFMVSYMIA